MSRWNLPKSWLWAKAGAIADIVGGGTPSTKEPENFAETGIPWLTPADLSGYQKTYMSRGKRDLSQKGYQSCGAQLMPRDSVLFTSRAPVGYCALAANEICTNQGFKSLVLRGDINPKSIRHYLLASKDYAESLATGSTFKELSGSRMAELDVPIAPLNEQKRVVAKIDELQSHSRRAREALEAIPDLLDQLRQSVLAAAFRGDLTRKWREQHPDVEPSSELLKRIRIERRKRWEEIELKKLKAKGFTDEKLDSEIAKRRKQYKEAVPVDTTELPELPEGWCWISAEHVVPVEAPIVYGIILPGSHVENGVPFIRPMEILDDVIVEGPISRTSLQIAAKYERAKLQPGDIILSIVGTIGKVAVVPERLNGANITQSSARLRPWLEFVSLEYLTEALRSPFLRHQYDVHRFGNAVQRLNIAHVRSLAIPLPPLEEQSAVAAAIDERLKAIAKVLSSAEACLRNLEGLYHVILTKAFLGELVSQDPNDEPASVLLERIRKEIVQRTVKEVQLLKAIEGIR
jgi:type I restriction enzyme S subunit